MQNLLLEKRVVDLLDLIRNGVFIINTEGKLMACNKTERELLGKTKLEIVLALNERQIEKPDGA